MEDHGRQAWKLLMAVCNRSHSLLRETLAEFDLTLAQSHLLQLLQPGVPSQMSSLAASIGCDASNITGLVDKLEDRDLVARKAVPADRRIKMIVLTAKGERLRATVGERIFQLPPWIGALSPAERKVLRDLLKNGLDAESR